MVLVDKISQAGLTAQYYIYCIVLYCIVLYCILAFFYVTVEMTGSEGTVMEWHATTLPGQSQGNDSAYSRNIGIIQLFV